MVVDRTEATGKGESARVTESECGTLGLQVVVGARGCGSEQMLASWFGAVATGLAPAGGLDGSAFGV